MVRFEWITDPSKLQTRPPFDVPLYQSNRFVALPTLGAVVPGWILVVPRRRTPNLSGLNHVESQELAALVRRISSRIGSIGKVFCFEHGGQAAGTLSCGVDQAHLHVVPLSFDLVAAAIDEPDVDWVAARGPIPRPHFEEERSYLGVSDLQRRAYIGRPRTEVSQWFRRLIASRSDMPDCWDYRTHPMLKNVNRTASLVGRLLAHDG